MRRGRGVEREVVDWLGEPFCLLLAPKTFRRLSLVAKLTKA